MTSRLILVNQAAIGHAIKDWQRRLVGAFGSRPVVAIEGFDNLLYVCAHHGSLRHIAFSVMLCLPGTSPGLW